MTHEFYLAQLSILDTELKLTPAKTAFFSLSFLKLNVCFVTGPLEWNNVVNLYFSLPIKQYLNCCRNEIFFSVCVWAIFKPDFKLSSEESLSWTLKMEEIILLLQRNFLFIFCCYLFMFTSIWCLVSDLVPLNLICPCDAGAPWPRFDWMLFN